jgi:hypothetical protein
LVEERPVGALVAGGSALLDRQPQHSLNHALRQVQLAGDLADAHALGAQLMAATVLGCVP